MYNTLTQEQKKKALIYAVQCDLIDTELAVEFFSLMWLGTPETVDRISNIVRNTYKHSFPVRKSDGLIIEFPNNGKT